MEQKSLASVKTKLNLILSDETRTTCDRAISAVKCLLQEEMDEELPEIFELCTNLELPVGISGYDEKAYKTAWQNLLELCK